MFGRGKLLRKLRSQFAQQHEHGRGLETGHGRQIHPEHAVTFRARVELRFVALRFFVARLGRRQRGRRHVHPCVEGLEQLRDLFIATQR